MLNVIKVNTVKQFSNCKRSSSEDPKMFQANKFESYLSISVIFNNSTQDRNFYYINTENN